MSRRPSGRDDEPRTCDNPSVSDRQDTAVLLALAQGLVIGGVTTWAVRLAGALAARGRRVAMAIHAPGPGQTPAAIELDPRVRRIDLTAAPPMEHAGGARLGLFVPAYARAVRELSADARPVVVCPTLLGDCFGVAAALTLADSERVRIVGWQHSPIEYDARVLSHYEPVIAAFAAVSDALESGLRSRLPLRGGDVVKVPNGVWAAAERPTRPDLRDRPLRLIYTGRLDAGIKRVLALVAMSDELTRAGVGHRLTILGDGPAGEEIDRLAADRPSLRRLVSVPPPYVERMLDEHDVFVLPSRVEGMSMSALEAMGRGCCPVMTRTPSGASQLVDDGRTGVLVDVPADADDARVGAAMAAGVRRAASLGVEALGGAALAFVRERFGAERSLALVEQLVERAAAMPARVWPADRPVAFTASVAGPVGSGSVPADGAERMAGVLRGLAGRRVVVHGAGRHTIELASCLAASAAAIVALADDDPGKIGRSLWGWPIVAPAEAARTGATDVVISTWMNEDAVWARRSVYERQGLRVHRLYAGASDRL